jgi:hypothetical protein
MDSFDSTKKGLFELLKDVEKGKIQLPDFQRGWVWDDFRIKGLLASVAKSFPIGAIMLLETGNDSVRFKTKPIESVQLPENAKPEMLILDGQQRLTSLYQTIFSNKAVVTRNSRGGIIKRWYYIDMAKAMDPDTDLEEAIFSINENKILTENIGRDVVLDLSKQENEFEKLMYPVNMVDEMADWYPKFFEYWKYDSEKIKFWNEFMQTVIYDFNHYDIPVIVMKKENPKEAVCQVFEKVNTGGVSLTVFELLTATFAADEFDLKEDWTNIQHQFRNTNILYYTSNTDLLQAITLYATYKNKLSFPGPSENAPAVSAKRKEMLNLKLSDYLQYKNIIVEGFKKAATILKENHIYSWRDLPYSTQLIPMAAILAHLGSEIDNMNKKAKLMKWFWNGVFGELYGAANETRYALDLTQGIEWIQNEGPEPKTVFESNFSHNRLFTLRTRNSAAYKGVYALMLEDNPKDWISGTQINFSTYFDDAIDIHHIFPVAWCEKKENGISPDYYNSIINKTPLSGPTNKFVSGDAPSKYLERIMSRRNISKEQLCDVLKGHIVNPDILFENDFMAFFEDRKEQILQRIEFATGKKIVRENNYLDDTVYEEEPVGELEN